MKIIFQDIDGPLIPFRLYFMGNRPMRTDFGFFWDPIAVMMLNKLCEDNGAQVVFNTAHNESMPGALALQAKYNGLKHVHPAEKTRFMQENGPGRAEACTVFLKEHGITDSWCVIDDMYLGMREQVKVDFNIGMDLNSFTRAHELLSGKKHPSIISIMGDPHDRPVRVGNTA